MAVTLALLRRLPKSDLHSHIDGSVPLKELYSISRRHKRKILTQSGNELDSPESLVGHVQGDGLHNLLEQIVARFFPIVGLMQTEDVLREVGVAYVAELRRHNVAYAEGRFAPQYHTREGLTLEEAIDSMAEGLKEGRELYGVRTNLIVAVGREAGEPAAKKVARAAVRSRRAVALDLGGSEEGHPPGKFAEAFSMARRGGLRRTVHAGEEAGSVAQNLVNIRSAILDLDAERVGHAIDIWRDSALIELARKKSVTLEMNPVSNRVLRKIGGPRDLRIGELMKAGLRVTVNSDDPALWPGGSLEESLFEVCASYGFEIADVDVLAANSLLGSFATQREKEVLMDEYASARNRLK